MSASSSSDSLNIRFDFVLYDSNMNILHKLYNWEVCAMGIMAFASRCLALFSNSPLVRRLVPSGRILARGAVLNRFRFDTMIAA